MLSMRPMTGTGGLTPAPEGTVAETVAVVGTRARAEAQSARRSGGTGGSLGALVDLPAVR